MKGMMKSQESGVRKQESEVRSQGSEDGSRKTEVRRQTTSDLRPPTSARRLLSSAFTLVELLVVIAIIAILAALIVAGAGVAISKGRRSAVKAELAQIEVAIANYQSKIGSYPPDNTNDASLPPLFYELVGTTKNGGVYENKSFNVSINAGVLPGIFFRQGFVNSDPETVRNFFPAIPPKTYTTVTNSGGTEIHLLVVRFDGPPHPTGKNPWRYNRSNPEHNKGKYDLWAEILIGGKTNIIGNWKEK